MALAYLCKQLETQKLVPDLRVTAFVVDHKAREESSREARTVAGWLADLGLDAQILELEWPSSANVSAFETHARRLRFQALGRACADRDIPALLMGHHQDDNVETTLWRLSCGARGAGLAGIPAVARIPECHGLYGVSESGSRRTLLAGRGPAPQEEKEHGDSSTTSTTSSGKDGHRHDRITMAAGGILICRPLLAFPKSALLATCHAHRVPFVSDPTNFDPTLTPRNAIRALLASSALPRALHPPSILSLTRASHALLDTALEHSNALLRQCSLLDFNAAAASMDIAFPGPLTPLPAAAADPQIHALTLRRITDLIAPHPQNHFPLPSFEKLAAHIFPSPSLSTPQPHPQAEARVQVHAQPGRPFTLGGVLFTPLSTNSNSNSRNTWRLARQPFMRHRLPTQAVQIPPTAAAAETYSPWTLWDHRFWMRFAVLPDPDVSVSGRTYRPDELEAVRACFAARNVSLRVRPLQQADLQVLRRIAGEGAGGGGGGKDAALMALLDRLARDAPGQTRFTVPVLVMEHAYQGHEGEVLLALPTLDCWLPSASQAQELLSCPIPWTIRWEWMFKSIDEVPLKLMAWL
ncbi:tRNA lysidine(34) synthetase [Aspergillus clavatus NRRL 1]|uniref:tRNA(Ile)-lysidine synthetase n=1 Tax=Aspergillus clavatus (strain ATCC 1007 / CBS 513.65 / DSM 816 / NCTC 3887 / NRRL 1 / QM 1276 / 107) TaxID=344612 RepID=A1CBD6_ASPCL|nr:PP-loop family protein [Aspergillus clavatus NRRL 1]EAW13054.1 PP-loop family protein [Aspergillus clavatus NRRL 1]